ncbi:hypothetical protein AAJ76_890009913 [Vairimorpha ceranae]|uniref:Uncharacterized protein n=1 Tax=Vairimorpha ceranae TaxID=40302 RepID=A0A0F9Z8U2_9MICR|nr:hypothetical protein AAJ76_890009913 [Vairimorpha ceranae]KKO74274.1 hypothetical protein AAJ76_890009913 [Vairimorpha ceranae]
MIPTRNPKKIIRTFVSYPIDDITSGESASIHKIVAHKKSSDNQYTYDIKTTDSKADDDLSSIFDRFLQRNGGASKSITDHINNLNQERCNTNYNKSTNKMNTARADLFLPRNVDFYLIDKIKDISCLN